LGNRGETPGCAFFSPGTVDEQSAEEAAVRDRLTKSQLAGVEALHSDEKLRGGGARRCSVMCVVEHTNKLSGGFSSSGRRAGQGLGVLLGHCPLGERASERASCSSAASLNSDVEEIVGGDNNADTRRPERDFVHIYQIESRLKTRRKSIVTAS
jgi:hypothetical protein